MVNVGFPGPNRYGFEMVARQPRAILRKFAINGKFTPNPMIRIFREFSAI
jgi:hypothetical protein